MILKCYILYYVVLFFTLVKFCENARILAIMPTPSYSHQIVFQPLWTELSRRGHEITLLTTDPIKNHDLKNFKQIDISFTYELWHNKHNLSNIIRTFQTNLIKCILQYSNMMHDIVSQELEHPEVQKLIHNKSEHFDLVIVELLHPTMAAFSARFNCPFIGVSPMDIPTFNHYIIGNPTNPSTFTDGIIVPYDSYMTFFERFKNTFYHISTLMYFNYFFYPKEDSNVKKYFGDGFPKLKEIHSAVSIVFVNTNPVLFDVRPLLPNVVPIGGLTEIKLDKNLPLKLQNFLDTAENGFIYFSLGTNVKITDLSHHTRSELIETMKSCPFKVVWKTDSVGQIGNYSNIYVGNWLPQRNILAHPKIKLFITQGGLQSLEEAIFYSVPVVGIPFYVDQFVNIRRLVKKGACIKINYYEITKNNLDKAISEMTTNPKFKKSAERLSEILKDQQISGLEKSIWWTEYVIKHGGAKHLKLESHLPFYQYYLLDVIFCIILFIFIYFLLFFKCLITLMRYYIKSRGDKNVKLE